MKNNLILASVAILVGFGVGYVIFGMEKTGEPEKKIIQKHAEVVRDDQEKDSPETDQTVDYSKKLSGKFILKGSEYAGFDFRNKKKVYWTNELIPHDPDELQIKWIDGNTFLTIADRVEEQCPPRISVYKVVKFDGKHLNLKEFDTTRSFKDSTLEYDKAYDE